MTFSNIAHHKHAKTLRIASGETNCKQTDFINWLQHPIAPSHVSLCCIMLHIKFNLSDYRTPGHDLRTSEQVHVFGHSDGAVETAITISYNHV